MHCNCPEKNFQVKPLIDIIYVFLHTLYTCDDNMYSVRYLLTGKDDIG